MVRPQLRFVAMIGSLRAGSFNRAVANTLDELAPDDVAVVQLGSVGRFPHYCQDVEASGFPAEVVEMGAAVAEADAVVILSPEYNRSIPGGLKNALDWLSRLPDRPLRWKPVAIQTASPGPLGGSRSQSHLRQVLVSLDSWVLNGPEVILAQVEGKVDRTADVLRDEAARLQVAGQLAALAHLVRQVSAHVAPVAGDTVVTASRRL